MASLPKEFQRTLTLRPIKEGPRFKMKGFSQLTKCWRSSNNLNIALKYRLERNHRVCLSFLSSFGYVPKRHVYSLCNRHIFFFLNTFKTLRNQCMPEWKATMPSVMCAYSAQQFAFTLCGAAADVSSPIPHVQLCESKQTASAFFKEVA